MVKRINNSCEKHSIKSREMGKQTNKVGLKEGFLGF
jgi:hypothetical protein